MPIRRTIVAIALTGIVAGSVAAPGRAQTSNADRQRQLNQQILEAGTEEAAALRVLEEIRQRKAPIDARVAELDASLAAVQARLVPLQEDVARLAAELDAAQAALDAAQAEFEARRREFDDSVVQIYRSARRGATYDYVTAARPRDLVQGAKYLDQVNDRQRGLVLRVAQLRDEMDAHRKQVAQKKAQADAAAAEVERLRDQLAQLRAEIEPARAQAAAEAQAEEQQIASIRARKSEFERELAALKAESDRIAAQLRASTTPGVAGACDARPVPGSIVSGFGNRIDPIGGGTGFHAGVDMSGSMGTPVRACRAGQVVIAGWQGGYGNTVVIDHGGGMATLYAHQSQVAVSVGEAVSAGQVIGYVGSTGYSTGPHLHFEVRISGNPVNPAPYL